MAGEKVKEIVTEGYRGKEVILLGGLGEQGLALTAL